MDMRCRGFHFVQVGLRSERTVRSLFTGRGFSMMMGLTTRTKMQCSVRGPCVCMRDGISNFLGVLRKYHRYGVGRLMCTDSDDMCKLGAGIPFSRVSNVTRPIDLCTTAGGVGRLVTRACDCLCSVPAAKLHFFAMCNP